MIWRWSATEHAKAIGSFARHWLGSSMLDRLVPVSLIGFFWLGIWFWIGVSSMNVTMFAFCFFVIGAVPWWLWLLDSYLDAQTVKKDTRYFLDQGAILATRCEYLGGHPNLPQGRFAYLLLEGTKQNPVLNLVFPQPSPLPAERFTLPLLDLKKTKPEKGSDESAFADVAAAINESAGKLFRSERLTLVIDYDGYAGRTHKVELTNFFEGNNDIRNWRNYMVCAQAESDTGVTPHEPWKSLKDDRAAGLPHAEGALLDAVSRNGHQVEQASSAFARR